MASLRERIPDDETVRWYGTVRPLFRFGVPLVTLLGVTVAFAVPVEGPASLWVSAVAFLVVGLPVTLVMYEGFDREYAVTSRGVYRRTGPLASTFFSDEVRLFGADVQFVPFESITAARYWRWMLTSGVSVTATDGTRLVFDGLGDRDKVLDCIAEECPDAVRRERPTAAEF